LDMAVNNGEILLGHTARFPDLAQFTGHFGGFGKQDNPTGFTVQTMNQMRRDGGFKMEPCATDQAGIFVALGGMTHETGWLVDHQQVGIFVNDFKQFFQAAKSATPRA